MVANGSSKLDNEKTMVANLSSKLEENTRERGPDAMDILKVVMLVLSNVAACHLIDMAPIVLDLQQITKSNTNQLIKLLIVYRAESCIAYIVAVPLLRWTGHRYWLGVAIIFQGIPIIFVAVTDQLYMTTILFCVYGTARAIVCLVALPLCNQLGRGKYSFLFVQLFFIGNSIGYSGGTFIQRAFVSQRLENVSAGLEYCQEHPVSDCEDEYIWMFYSKSYIYVPYAVFGGIAVVIGIVCIVLDKIRPDGPTRKKQSEVRLKTRKSWLIYCSILGVFFVVFTITVGIPAMCKMLLVSELVRSDAQMPKSEAVTVSAVYFAMKLLGQMSALGLNGKIKPIKLSMMSGSILVVTTAISGLLNDYGEPIYWFFPLSTAVIASTIIPPLGAYVCSEFPGDIIVVAIFEIGISVGLFVFPSLVVSIQKEESFQVYIFCHTAVASASLLTIIGMYFYVKKTKPMLDSELRLTAPLLSENGNHITFNEGNERLRHKR